MNCEEALILMSAAADGEATPEERAALEEHLNICPPCARLAQDFGVMSAALAEEVPCPAELTGRIAAALDKADAAAAKKPALWKRYGSLAAVLVLVAAGGLFALRGNSGLAFAPRAADSATGGSAAYSMEENALTQPDMAKTEPNPAIAPLEPPESETREPATQEEVTQALDLLLDFLGGADSWPNAYLSDYNGYPAYQLSQEEGTDIDTEVWLEYTGWSGNGKYHTFQLREYGTDKTQGVTWATHWNDYAVSVDGEQILFCYDDDRTADHAQEYRSTIHS